MAEMTFTLYVSSKNADENAHIKKIIEVISEFGGKDWSIVKPELLAAASKINSSAAKKLVDELTNSFDECGYGAQDFSLSSPDKGNCFGYWTATMVFGTPGPAESASVVEFFGALSSSIDARGYLVGDEEPWEAFYRYMDGEVVEQDYSPYEGKALDNEALTSGVYAWWHENLPEGIKEGHLNSKEARIYWEEEYIVFTGKMENGTREEMEDIAADLEANVQKSINGKTTLLVVGSKPGNSKLTKAKELGVKIITEEDFNRIVEDY